MLKTPCQDFLASMRVGTVVVMPFVAQFEKKQHREVRFWRSVS